MPTVGRPETPRPQDELSLAPRTVGSGIGRSHGTSYDRPFDRWYRYPAGFASDYAGLLLEKIELRAGHILVDPFAGAAVAGTSARIAGCSFYGIEAHPEIAELGSIKLRNPPEDPVRLVEAAKRLVDRAIREPIEARAVDDRSLIGRSFNPDTLQRLLLLRDEIKLNSAEPWLPYLKWALLSTLRDVASVKVGWPYQQPSQKRKPRFQDPAFRFIQRVQQMSDDLHGVQGLHDRQFEGTIIHGDSRNLASWRLESLADGCITSPPYLNNFDYADATRLEMYFWGEISTWAELCSVVRKQMLTATTQQSRNSNAQLSLRALEAAGSVGTSIAGIVLRLSQERQRRPRGKEYDQVVPEYFNAMNKVLQNLSISLRPGAPVALLVGDSAPYGVYIDTPALLAGLAKLHGLKLEEDTILRHRGQRWKTRSTSQTQAQLTERLVLLRKE